jgi:hypothetical protein
MEGEEGSELEFDQVLLLANGELISRWANLLLMV